MDPVIPANVTVREARPEEYDAVGALMLEAYLQYTPPDDAPQDRKDAFAEYFASIPDVRSRLAGAQLFVAETDRLVGAVTFYPPSEAGAGENFPSGWASFRLLAVHPSARGLGVGRLLTDLCLQRARALGAVAMGLHTTELMHVARAMYERMGFTRMPENDFWPTPDFRVMAYRLPLT